MSNGFPSSVLRPGVGAPRVWGVNALVQAISDSLATRFAGCVVRGEIGGFTRAASGHGYFTLKDEHGGAGLRCAMFRRALSQVDFEPAEGMLVQARGNLSVYEARGELQLVVEGLERAGAGALYEQFLRLKARLEVQGLFDADRKRPLPRFPRRVAVVTSLGAAALRDVLTAMRRRAPHVEVVIAPSAVQGVEAPSQLVQALAGVTLAHRTGLHFDAVIVCRGGGSLEDLWAFNDERVIHAMAGCPVPIISGVGHETDVTLADFVADLRAPTPTAAAELVAHDRDASLNDLDSLAHQMRHRVHRRLDSLSQRLDQAATRVGRPSHVLTSHRQRLALLSHRLSAATQARVGSAQQTWPTLQRRLHRATSHQLAMSHQHLGAFAARLQGLSPQRVLERGYAWLQDASGQPITRAADANVGQAVTSVMADGRLSLNVAAVHLAEDAKPASDGPAQTP